MRKIGLFEAKQKLSELVERAGEGECIGITRRGKLAAPTVAVHTESSLKDTFQDIARIRKLVKRHKEISAKDLIEDGRR
jgi:prevent-host-death family protein